MQFEDAPDDLTAPSIPPHPSSLTRIDDETVESQAHQQTSLASSTTPQAAPEVSEEQEEEYDSDDYYYDEEEEEERYGLEDGLREVMDQDWADASGGKHLLLFIANVI